MELLAYIQQDIQQDMLHGVIADEQVASHVNSANQASNIDSSFRVWLRQLTSKSVKLSFSVILAGTTALIGLGSALSSLAAPSSDITYVQTLLAQNGFNPGEIDGIAGAATKDAIMRAQKTFGLPVDGIAGEQTIAALSSGGTNASTTPESSAGITVANTDNVIASSSVMNLQKLLSDRGFYNGAVDGIMGPQTRDAIIAAQKAYNLTADGVAGPRTLAALEADTGKAATAPIPTKDSNVAILQELLSKRGFYSGAIDGIMGPQTRLAIVAAQKNYGLVTDGIAGRQTIAALEANTAPTPAAKTPEPATTTAPTIAPQVSQETKNLQELLASRGFYKGAIDGIKGEQTSAAIIAAQKTYGLTADGVAGTQTITALERDQRSSASTTVAPAAPSNTGDRDIANLQNLLTDRGFYNGAITGVIGPKTREAIIAAQKAYGLTADGIAGSRTIAALEAGAAPVAPIPQPAPANTPVIRVETKPQTTVSQPVVTPQPAAVVTPQPAPAAPQPAPAVNPQPAPAAPQPAAPQPAAITASNTQITELQNLLAKRGFYNGKVDGVLNGETRNAIVRAQNFYTIAPADGAPSNKLVESLSKDTFISSESN